MALTKWAPPTARERQGTTTRQTIDHAARQVNRMPRGRIASASSTTVDATSAGAAADVTGLTTTFTLEPYRYIETTVCGHVYSTTAGDTVRVILADGSNNIIEARDIVVSSANEAVTFEFTVEENLADGTYTRKVRVGRAAGAGTVHFFTDTTPRTGRIIVRDTGSSV